MELPASEVAVAFAEQPGRYGKGATRSGSSNSRRSPPNLKDPGLHPRSESFMELEAIVAVAPRSKPKKASDKVRGRRN